MGWHHGPLVSFDVESTGVSPEDDRIVTATVWSYQPGMSPVENSVLVDPGVEIPAAATSIHGITTEYARENGIPAGDAARLLAAELADHIDQGVPVVVYNAPFDLTMLERECQRHGVPSLFDICAEDSLSPYFVDPLVLDRWLDSTRQGSRRLMTVCAAYGIELSEDEAHTSAGDALAAARLAYKLAVRFPEVAGMSLSELQQVQGREYRRQAEQAAARFQGMGVERDVSFEWPVRSPMLVV